MTRWLFGAVVLIAAVLIVFIIVAPRLVNLASVRKALVSTLSQQIGGDLQFQKIGLSLLPRPHLVLKDGRVTVPPGIEGRLKSLSVSARLLPLFTGKIQIRSIHVEQPAFSISVSDFSAEKDGGRRGSVIERLAEKLKPLAGGAAAFGAPVVSIEQGRLTIRAEDRFRLDFNALDARVEAAGGRLETTLRTRTDFCEKIVLRADIDPQAATSRGRIDLNRFRPQRMPPGLLPAGTFRIGHSLIDLSVEFSTDAAGNVDATLEGALPQLTVVRGKKRLVLQGQNVKVGFHWDDRQIAAVLGRLRLEQPKLELAGRFRRDEDSGQMELEAKTADLEVTPIRRAALELAGDMPVIQKIFDIIRNGKLTALDFATRGKSVAELSALKNTALSARMLQGDIVVPGLRLPVAEVDAQLQIADRMLRAKHIRARYENTRVLDGSMRLGLSGAAAAPFHLDIGLAADLGRLMPVMKQVVKAKRILAEMERIAVSGGQAHGRLILGETVGRIAATVKISDFALEARVAPVSAPLSVSGTGLVYTGAGLTVERLTGRLKNSSVSLGAVDLNWREAVQLEIRTGSADLRLAELHDGLSALQPLNKNLKSLKAISGTVIVSNLRMRGPPASFSEWDFRADGNVQQLRVEAERLPAPLSVRQAGFSVTPRVLTLFQTQVGLMDIAGTVSGRLSGYLAGIVSADLELQGTVGARGNRWLQQQVRIPSTFVIRPPLVFEKGRLRFRRNRETAFSGDLRVRGGLRLSLDLSIEHGLLNIRQLVVRDGDATAAFTLRLDREKQMFFSFRGDLYKETVDKLLSENRLLDGWIKGDLRVQYAAGHLLQSVFEGNLRAKKLAAFQRFGLPLQIVDLSISGVAHKFNLSAAVLIERKTGVELTGDVNYSPDGIRFDADLSADGIELDRWAAALGLDRNRAGESRTEKFWDFPLQGVVRLNSAYLTYGRYTWRDLQGTVALHPEKISVTVDAAKLCGISTPGTVTILPREIALAFKPAARRQEIETVSACLLDKSAKVEGRFDLNSEIAGRGLAGELQQALAGSFEYKTGRGRLYAGGAYRTIREILALLNVTEIFRGKLPELNKKGFGFNSMEAKGKIRDNKLVLEEVALDGLTVTMAAQGVYNLADGQMDMTVLVAPLKTVDAIIRLIPLVGDILGGSLVSVPVRVRGNLDSPRITILPPEAVGEGLLGIIKRTLQLPVKIIEPLIPAEKK